MKFNNINEAVQYISDYLDVSEFVYEKKSKEEYARDKFNKRYDFVPDKDAISKNKGTIKVGGKRYKFGVNNKENSSGVTPNLDSFVNLNKNTFKLKNSKRQDFILHHEIGHDKMHSPNMDPKFKTDETMNRVFREILIKLSQKYPDKINDEWVKNRNNITKLTNDFKSVYGDKTVDNINRDEMYKYIKNKYINNKSKNQHLTPDEIEADRYSANKVGTKNAQKSLRESEKRFGNKKSKVFHDEVEIRSKALKDDKLKNNDLYKNI